MRFDNRRGWTLLMSLPILVLAASFLGTATEAQENDPQMVTLKGRLVDLTCAVKGKVMTGEWNNIAQDHMIEDGSIQKRCATVCLLGGQPAGLFFDNKITAVFACNPQGSGAAPHQGYTLAGYIANKTEVRGHWADGGPETGIFIPVEIRRGELTAERRYGSGGWYPLDCGAVHE